MNLMDLAQRIAEQEVSRIGEGVLAHTPGPWKVDGAGIHAMVRGADSTIVAVRHRLPRETHEANCRLIAAAPELLECLKAAVTIIGHPDDSMTKHFNEVIAKAESKD